MRRTPHLAFWLSLVTALILQLVALPPSLAAVRPLCLPLVLCYWALTEPRVPVLLCAFLFGLMVDVLFDSVLGQHALGGVLAAYLVIKLRSLFLVFPLWQSTVALIPVWAVYTVLMFWIDGVSQHHADPWLRWVPIVSTTLFWPLVYALLETVVRRRRSED
jgi:rod shape-determining protein MreD